MLCPTPEQEFTHNDSDYDPNQDREGVKPIERQAGHPDKKDDRLDNKEHADDRSKPTNKTVTGESIRARGIRVGAAQLQKGGKNCQVRQRLLMRRIP